MLGRSKTLQVARQWTNEDFGQVAGQRKVAPANNVRELAEWGGSAGNGWTCSTRSDQVVRAIGGSGGCSTINPTDPVV